MTIRTIARFVVSISLAVITCLASACAPASMHGADDYFEGKALELAIATEQGDADAIRRLIKEEHVDPDTTFSNRDGIPIVAWPLRARSLEGLQALLEAGADPNARQEKQMNGALIRFNNAMVYAVKMDDSRYLELLLKHGGDPNTRNGNNEPLTLQAFLSGNQWKNVQTLIENGANINDSHLGADRDTVLSWYTARGGFNYAYWLLERGADPTLARQPVKGSSAPARQMMIEEIYWGITSPELLPWQKKCQQWLIDRDIARPPMPEHIRRTREAFGFPSKEEDIPLL